MNRELYLKKKRFQNRQNYGDIKKEKKIGKKTVAFTKIIYCSGERE